MEPLWVWAALAEKVFEQILEHLKLIVVAQWEVLALPEVAEQKAVAEAPAAVGMQEEQVEQQAAVGMPEVVAQSEVGESKEAVGTQEVVERSEEVERQEAAGG